MKTLALLSFLCIPIILYCQAPFDDLENRNGIWFKIGESSPFSGEFIEKNNNNTIIGKGSFLNGLASGERIQYYSNGNKSMERNYVEGLASGSGTDYFENGNIKLQGIFKDGLETGKWIYYYESREKHVVFYYKNGVMHGEYLEYNKSGDLLKKRYARNGNTGYSDEFNENIKRADELRISYKFQDAIPFYDMAIEINPTVARAYFGRAESKGYSDFGAAIVDYDTAIYLNPEYMIAYRNRGILKINTYTSKGNLNPTAIESESACIDLNKAKKLGDKDDLMKTLLKEHCKRKR